MHGCHRVVSRPAGRTLRSVRRASKRSSSRRAFGTGGSKKPRRSRAACSAGSEWAHGGRDLNCSRRRGRRVVQLAEPGGQRSLFCLFGGVSLLAHRPKTGEEAPTKALPPERSGFRCPSQSGSCSQPLGYSFGRKDAVKEHCKRFPACMASLQANNNVVVSWGVPGTAQGLVPYDPLFHKSYRS